MHVGKATYYAYILGIKSKREQKKEAILKDIVKLYQEHKGIIGYRLMHQFLLRRGHSISINTVYRYMRFDLHLQSITRRKRYSYKHKKSEYIADNIIQREFMAQKPNQKWCIDFTYLPVTEGKRIVNCTIIDIYDRSVIASTTTDDMSSETAIQTVLKGIKSQKKKPRSITIHSDRGSQFTSKTFVEFCKNNQIRQSMSQPGCPYDNSPMERFFNTLKTELIHVKKFNTIWDLQQEIEEFSYIWYNHIRPHSYNDYLTPFEKRFNLTKRLLRPERS